MHKRMTTSVGFVAALLALAATQLPETALALNPQPEVPSMPTPEPLPHPDPALKFNQRVIEMEKSKAKRYFAPRSVTVLY